jgi:hypothetical protein
MLGLKESRQPGLYVLAVNLRSRVGIPAESMRSRSKLVFRHIGCVPQSGWDGPARRSWTILAWE